MITHSTSSTFSAEATPAPSARMARSIMWIASSSSCSSARAQMPLVSARALALLHQLEQVGLAALLDELARVRFHRRATGVGLHAAAPPARAARAVQLDDDVPDLRRAAAPAPRLAVEHDAAADARSPEDAEQRVVGLARRRARTRRRSRPARRCRARPRSRAPSSSVSASGKVPSQPGRLRALVTAPSVDRPGRADADARQRARLDACCAWRFAQRALDRLGDVLRAAAGRRRTPRRAEHRVVVVDDHRLDLRAAEIDAAVACHRADHGRRTSVNAGPAPTLRRAATFAREVDASGRSARRAALSPSAWAAWDR